jgi:hypothetical protein
MSELDKHISIPKNIDSNNDLDYSFLRKKGLDYIQQFSSKLWTDYNSHDPGVTILEMLCYALTDLGLRISTPLEDILAPENKDAPEIKKQFFTADRILTSNPVTELDYRKLFIDIKGVKNCWLKPYKKKVSLDPDNDKLTYKNIPNSKKEFFLQGLYSIIVDFDKVDITVEDDEYIRIKEDITNLFHANRNLCEDLVEISKVETHPISVCASIDVYPDADEELVHAKVLHTINNYFSPSIKFYSLKQMYDKNYTSDEIFEGPILKNGYIDNKELKAARLNTEIRLSDLIQLIMDIEGVNIIKDISIADCNNYIDEKDIWIINVDEGKKPVLCLDSAYSYYKGVLPVNINSSKVENYLIEFEIEEIKEQERASIGMDIEIPVGTYLNISETTTIQNDFPDTYGTSAIGLMPPAGTERKSKAKQLKAYLLFFDQILATYFAHLGKVKDLLSIETSLKQSYFTQAVKDIKDFKQLISDYPDDNSDELTDLLLSELDDKIERKNKILDHLMARFAEQFSEYAFLMKELYGDFADNMVIDTKEKFIKNYAITGKQRGSAFNYFNRPETKLWNTDNIAGIQKRIAGLVGIKNYKRRNLSNSFAEIYDLIDSDNIKVYRWRIFDEANEIILSATQNYKTTRVAEDEMYMTIVKIIETSIKTIEEAFTAVIVDEQEIGNFEIQLSPNNKYSIDIINLKADKNSVDRIIARQYTYYTTQEELKDAILKLIEFMRSVFTEEGMFLVEHILLLPNFSQPDTEPDEFIPVCPDIKNTCEPIDPYSYRVTVVLPGWTYRFSNLDFRNFLEELIRKELPAHILARICWIGYRKDFVPNNENQMLSFEDCYRKFLISKTKSEQTEEHGNTLKDLIKIIGELNSIYPSGRLIDCDDEDDSIEGKIILGRTNLGNL